MQTRVALLSAALSLLCSCDIIDWPNVPPDQGGGPGPTGEQLTIENGSLAGFRVWEPQQRQNHPDAGEPNYVYLLNGQDAVRLAGVPVTDQSPTLFALDKPAIVTGEDTITVRVNERLSYLVEIDDFEGEVALARVDLQKGASGSIDSTFIFAARGEGLGGGVAHNLTIHAVVAGVDGARTSPVTIEAR